MAKSNVPSDIDIAQAAEPKPIGEIASQAGFNDEDYDCYGRFIAKVTSEKCRALRDDQSPSGKLILVTAMSPTPAGEGKTAMARADAGLLDGCSSLRIRRAISLGPAAQ